MTQTTFPGAPVRTIDDAVRAVTAFQWFADLKATQPTYAPSFYPGRATTQQELVDMRRVAVAFNAWGARNNRREAKVFAVVS